MATVAELLVKIGADPSNFEKAIKRTEKSLAKMGKKLTRAGETLTKGLTVPIAGLGVAAFASANDLDEAYGQIRAGTGATGDDLEGLKESFKTVFKDVPQSADEVSQALADINTRTGQTGPELEALTKQFLDLGRVSGEDVPTLIKNGTRAFGDWGIEVEDQADTMDYFWKVSQTTGVGVSDLMNKVVQFGAPMRQMGFDFETSAALLGKFEKEGVNTELVMGSMRQALGKMAREGIGAEEGLQKTIEAVKAAGSTSEANALAMELFGARAGPDMAAAIREGRFEVDELMATLSASGETITKAGEDTLTFGDKFSELKNKTQTALEPLGDILLKLAEEWLPKVTGALEKVAGWFTNLNPGIQKVIVIVGIVVAAIGPLLIAFGAIISAVGAVIPVLAFLVSPIGLIIAAVVLLAILIIANWETIKTVTITVWNAIADFFVTLWEGIKSVLTTAWESIADFFSGLWTIITDAITTAWNAVSDFLSGLWDGIKATADTVWNSIKDFFGLLWDGIVWIFENLTLAGILITHWDEITATIENVWNGIKKFMGDLWGGLSKKASEVFGGIRDALGGIWDNITDKVKSVWDGIVSTIKDAINFIIGAINKFIDGINRIKISVPAIEIPLVGKVGGFSISLPNIPNIPQLATGTNNVPQDMFSMLHEGEAVVPKKYNNNNQGNDGNVFNININANDEVGGRAAARGFTEEMTRRGWRPQGVL